MREKAVVLGLFSLGIFLLAITAFLFYQDRAPQDDSAASVYYLSPNGNDSNNGSNSSPWKTISKAMSSISAGDTVILKDGTYSAYFNINKPNTTWRAENKHKAIIDGGFGPGLLNGEWKNIVSAWDSKCKNIGMWSPLVAVSADNVEVEGLFLRNSCGRGVLVAENVNYSKFLNNRIDWTFVSGFYVSGKTKGLQMINNELTRISFNDQYTVYTSNDYNVNISIHMSGEDMVVRGNIIAWGRGEIAMTGSRNLLFEDNIIIGNKNNFYNGWADGVIVRNNLFWAPESQLNPNTHWEKKNGNENDWHISSRNEKDARWGNYASGLNNVAYYNNIILNNSFLFSGYHKDYSSNTTNVYFGHNTLVTGKETNDLFNIVFAPRDGSDSKITGLIENNIFDVSKDPSATIKAALSGNDDLVFRNNILPASAQSNTKGPGDIYTTNPELQNSLVQLNYPIPAIGAATVDMTALRAAVDLNNYRLKQSSPAINAGISTTTHTTYQIPQLAKSQDFFKNSRVGNPDIGAVEYGGVYNTSTPTPLVTATQVQTSPTPTTSLGSTPTLTPTLTLKPTPPLAASNTPTPPITGNICGKADIDGDGKFSIADFAEFAKSYGTGKNTCADKDVEYGSCGGRDVNRDGKLNIADFGAAGIGFAQRYYPKLSCAI
ncbi:MAG TPA: DUF1565 domain-containing protein [Candidatus Dojkabacteria bacterium]|nr:DUF1565 domain-containing protein [Candidatus Dojkabacteria bacterium]HRO64860.1 DUF1565 domain-containing protein [Candidatus Dojkabacteria bacterium]HRP37143.1 DUF1565 domain-containing protein [Candidatus Dojkabacteria bacterium]HRP51005.1 DUF1565 domain-containing protein [Candidatus Dojkabacteria bacterium]